VVCLNKIVPGLRSARSYLGALTAAAWLIFGLATLEIPHETLCAQSKAVNTCFCELSSTVSQAHCRRKSRQCRRASREVRQNELQSGLLSYSQRRG
jgi:hypothetical protein